MVPRMFLQRLRHIHLVADAERGVPQELVLVLEPDVAALVAEHARKPREALVERAVPVVQRVLGVEMEGAVQPLAGDALGGWLRGARRRVD